MANVNVAARFANQENRFNSTMELLFCKRKKGGEKSRERERDEKGSECNEKGANER